MKKKLAIAAGVLLLVVAISAPPLAACLNCYSVNVPDPGGGPSTNYQICLELGGSGWYQCVEPSEDSLMGLFARVMGWCYLNMHCSDGNPGWPPTY